MKRTTAVNLLNEISIDTFLADYWQKKPLLIRNAYPNIKTPITANELAGLSCEEEVESRIVIQNNKTKEWELMHGPFNEKVFSKLPASHWTLLVQAVDHWVPEAAELLNQFNFIPRWRIDDLMISYASDGGGVGPHYDNYDVFLLQSSGKRKWEIGSICNENTPMRGNLPVTILREFDAIESWELEAGDILYVPPGFAHNGVALGDDCITCSIGFRAPSHNEILREFTDYIGENLNETLRYTDPDLIQQSNTGEINAQALEKLQYILLKYCNNKKLIGEWFGQYITAPKYPQTLNKKDQNNTTGITINKLSNHLTNDGSLIKNESSRFAFEKLDNKLILFVDGELINHTHDCIALIETICSSYRLRSEDFIHTEENLKLLLSLLQKGSLYLSE